MNKTISLLCPTRERPHRVHEMLESIILTTDKPENVEVLYYIDNDDTKIKEYKSTIDKLIKKYNITFKKIETYIGEPISISKSWNILAERCTGDVLVMANDDQVFITKGWDKRLNEEVAKFPDEIYCIHFNDAYQMEKLCCFPMVSRKWYETLGYFTPSVFKFIANDSWIEYIGRYLNRVHYVEDVIVEHRHFTNKKADYDDTYKKHRVGNNSNVSSDIKYFYSDECQNIIKNDALNLSKVMRYSSRELFEAKVELNCKVKTLERNYTNLESKISMLQKENDILNNNYYTLKNSIDTLINKIAWWIPIRKWRDKFRAKFK